MKVIKRAFIALILLSTLSALNAETPELLSPAPELTHEQEKELNCLAKNIYFEAGGETFDGKIAVAMVTLNRVESGKFPNTICGVVHQKTVVNQSKLVCQFSWVCQGNTIRSKISDRWKNAMSVARLVLLDGYRIPHLESALYFHAIQVQPNWRKYKVAKIGNHVFYRDH